ncbi:MAG: hypothetical protein H6626_10770 [Pseudobdellovibrionaceae bacterium]|nr:hypothetical protein [Bdellovibrionales bacterium]USN46687.1 MAG: hypothetical protein H6626_10770 [Pseudobdellovibrionaceae bacterium]
MSEKDINLEIFKLMIEELSSLRDELVFLGGSTISLFITEPRHVVIRETLDVDCVVEVLHRGEYENISKKLRNLGFNEDIEGKVLCRFKKQNLVLDVMPTDTKILGFTSIWYKDGFKNSIKMKVSGRDVKVFDLPYLMATKLEAFKGRGRGEYIFSHDIEDIVTLIDGRPSISTDLTRGHSMVTTYLKDEFGKLLNDQNFINSLDAHISDRENVEGRKKIILERMQNLIKVT